MAFVILVGVSWGKPIKKENVMEENDTSWNWHIDGDFKYPSTYKRSKLWVDDVPAYVEIFSDGKILLCYWPLLGAWSTQIDFPEEGVWLTDVVHSKVLVLIYPKSEENKVSTLINIVKDW